MKIYAKKTPTGNLWELYQKGGLELVIPWKLLGILGEYL
jgi:hypothetical protein